MVHMGCGDPPPTVVKSRTMRNLFTARHSLTALSKYREEYMIIMDGVIARDTRTVKVTNRHHDCVTAADYIEGHYPSPDIQPGGKVNRRCGMCRRLIPFA